MYIAVDKISALGYVSIPVIFLLFVLSFINRLDVLRHYRYSLAIFLPVVIFLYFAWNSSLIESRDFHLIEKQYWGYRVPTGPLFPYVIVWFEALTITAMVIIFRFYKRTLDIAKKRQAYWLIVATSIPLLFGTITNGILPIFNYPVFPSAIPLTSIMAVIIAYAIFRHELFDLTPNMILTNLGNGVITINTLGKIVQMNDSAKRMLTIKDGITGKGFNEIINLQNSDKSSSIKSSKGLLRYFLQTGEKYETNTFSILTHLKNKFPIECNITPIFHESKIAGITLVFRDITKEKEIEKSKNEFISIASHELKTPLTSIKLFSQILERKLEKKRDKENIYSINKINKQLNVITLLISDLLDVNKIEEGRLVLNKKKFKIKEFIQRVVEEVNYMSQTHQIIYESDSDPVVFSDEERVRQVLINLLTNAIKYSPDAKNVKIRSFEKKKEVVITVLDFGIGIPLKDRHKIFERYYRTNEKKTKNISGFGLGLYIASEIVKRHKGKIWVENPPSGKGSLFSFTLPIK